MTSHRLSIRKIFNVNRIDIESMVDTVDFDITETQAKWIINYLTKGK